MVVRKQRMGSGGYHGEPVSNLITVILAIVILVIIVTIIVLVIPKP